VVVDAGMDGPGRLGRQGRRDHDGAPGPRRWLTEVSHYRRYDPPNSTRFYLRQCRDVGNSFSSPWDGSGRRWRLAMARKFGWLRASTPASSGAPPVKMKAPKGAVVFGDPSEMVDSAWAVTQRCGGELGRRLGF
jgi:hypothetical protein